MTLQTIDDVRAYWDSRPCNSRHSDSPDIRQYSEEVTARKYFVEPHIPAFAEFEKWRGKRVLEIGCGIGTDTIEFAKAKADIFAIDLSEQSLGIARKRVASKHIYVGFRCADAEDLNSSFELRDYYDLVYAFGSIHHSPSPEQIIRNAHGVLKPGGTLKLMVYNKYSWKALWILLKYGRGRFWKFRELVARYSEAQTGCPITHVYSPKELRAMLGRNGFHVRKMYKDHIFKFDIEKYKKYEYVLAFPWKYVPDPIFQWLERHFGWHLLCEATA
jgi:2-polyprenyl-3-methyl-5-hydroxy-6-metoxy-1,4-benzoquinol methylase